MARRLDLRRSRQQHLRRDHRRVHGGREAAGLQGGAAVRADHRGQRGGGGDADPAAPGGRGRRPRPRAAACRSIARSATTTWCSRAAAVRDRSPAAAARPIATEGERVFRDTCAQCHRFGTLGKDYAPDLTKVAERLPRRDILRSIFFPNEKVDPKYATTVIATEGRQDHPRAGRQRSRARTSIAEDRRPSRSR